MTAKLPLPTAPIKSLQRARWLVKGRTLIINDQIVININRDCTVILKASPSLALHDSETSVRFWFRYPIEGATPYVFDQTTNQLRPATLCEESPYKQWLLMFHDRTAAAIRRRFAEL